MNLGRRSIMKAVPAAALLALAEMRGASATGNGGGGGSTCRNAGHSCNGNQTCCPGLDCESTGHGNSRQCTPAATGGNPCQGDGDCHEDCDCDGGTCTPGGGGEEPPTVPECGGDSDCWDDDVCFEGACIPAEAEACCTKTRRRCVRRCRFTGQGGRDANRRRTCRRNCRTRAIEVCTAPTSA